MDSLILLVLLIPLVLLMFRGSRQRKAVAQMQQDLAPGAEVMMTSGIFGRVSDVEGDRVEVEVAEDVYLWFLRQAVARVVEPAAGEELDDDVVDDVTDEEPVQGEPLAQQPADLRGRDDDRHGGGASRA